MLDIWQKFNAAMPVQKVTREEVIQKSLPVFRQRGYYNTSMTDLAEACGLQKGSFYHYFDSKESLMKEVLGAVSSYFENKIFAIAYDESLLPVERLQKVLDKQIRAVTNTKGGCLMGNTAIETALLTDEFKPIMEAFFDGYVKALAAIYSTQFSAQAANQLAQQAAMEFEGALILVKMSGKEQLLHDAAHRIVERLKS
ncbi:MAG: TetR/AcrR family transcriptional regulator [Cytophagia bacterium]|nr:MAG: TetR/AcrR family transcriptional regulator [Runella sp.]TAG21240.1 MAG: TetR/AcrR family transcriptional regulator [Cytophagales bacterium]TAG40331.1 MAG: TetR/AcrR family transcriptional regulator [Cytophagia bacterium]TAG58423.1 MAG: TetR/AcrR family transcriptional regulator [Runella slithyformis]TAG74461.1 MAG: TetR/AcrR family transcriptional regulator [Runella slithyformis]